MSHGDRVIKLAPGFEVLASSENAPFAVAGDEKRRFYSFIVPSEVVHTPDGARLLSILCIRSPGCPPTGRWGSSAKAPSPRFAIRWGERRV